VWILVQIIHELEKPETFFFCPASGPPVRVMPKTLLPRNATITRDTGDEDD